MDKDMIGGRIIALNSLSLTFSSLVNLGISVVTTSIIARSIGPELYGRYTFGLSYIMMFSVIANCGIESLFIRETARDRSNLTLIKDIFIFKIVLAALAIGAILLSAYILNYPSETIAVLYILCGGLFFQILSESILSVYRAVERIHITALFSTIFRIISAAIIGISVVSGIGFYGIVAGYSIGNALVFAVVFVFFWREFRLLDIEFNPSKWIELIRQGAPFYFSALLTMFYAKISIVILSKLVSEREMGFFMAAMNLVENLSFVPVAFVTSVYPAFSRLYGFSADVLKSAYVKMIKYLIIITVAVAAGTILVSEDVILLIYGSEFIPAVPVLNILIFTWVLGFFSIIQSTLLFSVRKEKAQAKIMAVAVFANAILSYFFINAYSYMGAAFASVLTEGIVVGIVSAVLWKIGFRFIPDLSILRLGIVATAMAVFVHFLIKVNVAIAIAGGAVFYVALLFAMKVFDADDIFYMKALFKRKAAHG